LRIHSTVGGSSALKWSVNGGVSLGLHFIHRTKIRWFDTVRETV
jgi:hypothetical protein